MLLGKVLIAVFLLFPAVSRPDPAGPLLWGFALDGYPITPERLAAVAGSTGITPSLVVFFTQWPREGDRPAEFPRESLDAIRELGAVPCLTWEPMYLREGREVAVSGEAILAGEYDRYLASFAAEARRWGKPLLVRFGHEMNLDRYHWGTAKEDYGPASPELYRKMFRYVVSAAREAGTDNLIWVFSPNAESVPAPDGDSGAAWNRPRNYYPGDGYVDVLGMDGYNWGTTRTLERDGWESSWQSFGEIFAPLRDELAELAPGKPIIVFETASVTEGGDKTRWIRDALETAGSWGLAGLVWFQADKEFDWRIQQGADPGYLPAVRSATSPSQHWIRRLVR